MQIKTVFQLISGVGIGYLIFADDESKEKAVHSIKKTLYKWQTGEDLDKKKKPVSYHTNYCNYKPKTTDKQTLDDIESELIKLLTFSKKDAAEEYLSMLKDIFTNEMSICDLFEMHKKVISFEYDKYGWTAEELQNAKVIEMVKTKFGESSLITGKYIIDLPEWHSLV